VSGHGPRLARSVEQRVVLESSRTWRAFANRNLDGEIEILRVEKHTERRLDRRKQGLIAETTEPAERNRPCPDRLIELPSIVILPSIFEQNRHDVSWQSEATYRFALALADDARPRRHRQSASPSAAHSRG